MAQAESLRAEDKGKSAVFRFDLATGKLLRRWDVAEGGRHGIGDMTVAPDGRAYFSDGFSGEIYAIRPDGGRLETVVKRGAPRSSQTPAVTPDGRRLLAPDYGRGIAVVDVATGDVKYLPHPETVALDGIDGLYLDRGALLAVQNGTNPNRVIRIRLDAALGRTTGYEVLEANSPQLGSPTHGVVVGRRLYLLGNTGWDRMGDDGVFRSRGAPAQVLRIDLR
jgi:hypothetical protein